MPLPTQDSFKELKLSYLISLPDYIPFIELDITDTGDEPWKYYIPKIIPKDASRTILRQPKRSVTLNGITLIMS